MMEMKSILKICALVFSWGLLLNQAQAQVSYELEIDSIVGLPDTIVDGEEVTFFMVVSLNSALFYQGNVFVELEYAGDFYEIDSADVANGYLGPNSPNTIQAHHKFSTEDDLQIGDNVVVVWPRIGNGFDPVQEVVNPYTTTITIVEPNGIIVDPTSRFNQSFISPNPAITSIRYNLNGSVKIRSSVLYDVTGRKVLRTNGASQVDVSGLPEGIYFVDVTTEKGLVYSDKLLISR
jgi:hypothetical protein